MNAKTIKLLNRLKTYLREEPRRLDMYSWGRFYADEFVKARGPHLPPCGTVGCVAGSVCIMTKKVKRREVLAEHSYFGLVRFPDNTPELAQHILGLTTLEAARLFLFRGQRMFGSSMFHEADHAHWPRPFEMAYRDAYLNPRSQVRITCDRIDYFIATNGTDEGKLIPKRYRNA